MTRIDPQHAFLINRNKLGSMVLAGETLFVLEMEPAAYAILATNEAEKAAEIKVVDFRMIGGDGPGLPYRRRGEYRARPPRRRSRSGGSVMGGHDRESLRTMVREAIREALAETRAADGKAPAPASGAEAVRLASDADLDAFVRRLMRLARDPRDRGPDRGRIAAVHARRTPRPPVRRRRAAPGRS